MQTEPLDAAVLDEQHHEHDDNDQGQQDQALERRPGEDDTGNDNGADEALPRPGGGARFVIHLPPVARTDEAERSGRIQV